MVTRVPNTSCSGQRASGGISQRHMVINFARLLMQSRSKSVCREITTQHTSRVRIPASYSAKGLAIYHDFHFSSSVAHEVVLASHVPVDLEKPDHAEKSLINWCLPSVMITRTMTKVRPLIKNLQVDYPPSSLPTPLQVACVAPVRDTGIARCCVPSNRSKRMGQSKIPVPELASISYTHRHGGNPPVR